MLYNLLFLLSSTRVSALWPERQQPTEDIFPVCTLQRAMKLRVSMQECHYRAEHLPVHLELSGFGNAASPLGDDAQTLTWLILTILADIAECRHPPFVYSW